MLSKIQPTFYSELFNWYWFGALCLTVGTSAWAVVFSHAQQYRQHALSRLLGDLFVREQLGFLSFCFALYISAYVQAEQKVLGPAIGILGVVGILFYASGLWLTSTRHVDEAFQRDKHDCPPDPDEACTKRPGWRVALRLIIGPALLFTLSFGYATALTFSVHQPSEDNTESNRVPAALRIASVRAGGEAYQGAPLFIQDNLDKLDQERRTAKSPDYVVSILESERLSSYGRFCWTVSLRSPDFETGFALSARGAYLVHATSLVSFADLPLHGTGDPYKAITAEIPGSQENDKIVLVVALYALSSKPVLHDLNVMLETRINCS